jgi:hypothetical protein
VIQIEKFAQYHAANSGEFLDHHTSLSRSFQATATHYLYQRETISGWQGLMD